MSQHDMPPGSRGSAKPGAVVTRLLVYLLMVVMIYVVCQVGIVIYAVFVQGQSVATQLDITNQVTIWLWAFFITAVTVLALTWVFATHLDGRPFETVGFGRRGTWRAELAVGTGLGIGLPAAMFAVSYALGWARVTGSAFLLSPWHGLSILVQSLLLMACIAAAEETVFRGYVLQSLRWRYGTAAGLAVSSALFGVLHLTRPGQFLAPLIGTTLAGLLLGYAYLATGRLWMPMGIHFGWNFALGPVLGFPVSGIIIKGWLLQESSGPVVWTGGTFGPEAGLLGWIVMGLGFVAVWVFSGVVRDPGPVWPPQRPPVEQERGVDRQPTENNRD